MTRISTRWWWIVLVLAGTHGVASAGRTRFGWLYGTDINPERGVELETWILQENQKSDAGTKASESDLWWGVVVSLSPHVEIAIPIEAEYHDDTQPPSTQFVRFGGEVRWRLQSPDPIEAGPFVTLLRAGVKRIVDTPSGAQVEADIVESYTKGPFLALVDLGAIDEVVRNGIDTIEIRPGAGVSFRVSPELRLGAETYGELTVAPDHGGDSSWMVVGPNLSLTSGRFWVAATIGVGVYRVRDAGRITFGVAL